MSSISPESAGDSRSALEASESIPNDGDSSSQASARNPTKFCGNKVGKVAVWLAVVVQPERVDIKAAIHSLVHGYYENDDTPWDRFGSNWPVETMVKTLSRYFEGVTADMVISEPKYADAYDPETNTIFYEGGRGGGPLCLRVTSWMQEGDRLVIDYEGYEYYSGVPWEDGFYTLTVNLKKPDPAGQFFRGCPNTVSQCGIINRNKIGVTSQTATLPTLFPQKAPSLIAALMKTTGMRSRKAAVPFRRNRGHSP